MEILKSGGAQIDSACEEYLFSQLLGRPIKHRVGTSQARDNEKAFFLKHTSKFNPATGQFDDEPLTISRREFEIAENNLEQQLLSRLPGSEFSRRITHQEALALASAIATSRAMLAEEQERQEAPEEELLAL